MKMQILEGLAVSEGITVGKAVCLETRNQEMYRFPLPPEEADEEVARFRRAARQAREETHALAERVGSELGTDLAGIFEAHGLLLRDTQLLGQVEDRIRDENVNAEWAVWETTEALRERFAEFEDERFRDRSEDIGDVARQLIRSLQGVSHHELSEISGDVVVIADDLTPSDAVRLGRQGVVGFALEAGGRTSHTAIIAHSLNIPLVTGLPGITRLAAHEDPVIVDGTQGIVILHPTPEVIEQSRSRHEADLARVIELESTRDLRAVSRDGVAVTLMANIDLLEEVADATRFGAEGIGLYRSEFLYIEKSPELPTEEDHYRIYRSLLEAMAPNPVVIRTFDLGGRKLAREVLETREDNPVLGLRGIRLTLARPEVFRSQIRGLFRAGCHGDLKVMLPLVTTVEEIRRFKDYARSVTDELAREGVPHCEDFSLGMMIEVPSAAIIADRFAREVDFFSIGTNDLIQYSMAVDRNNEHVTDLYQPLHPSLIRMIGFVVAAAREAEIEVGVCGEMAADPLGVAALLGLGVRQFSMSPRRIGSAKTLVRGLEVERLERAIEDCRDFSSAAEVRRHLEETLAARPESVAEGAE